MTCFPTVSQNCNFWQIFCVHLSMILDCFTVTIVNFTNNIFLSSVTTQSFGLQRSLCHSFSLVPSTYSKFTLSLISSFWISVACICCCDWDKLWLLVILYKILLIMLSWYPFSFSTCFILVFSLVRSSLIVIMEYALLNKEEITLFLQLVWLW